MLEASVDREEYETEGYVVTIKWDPVDSSDSLVHIGMKQDLRYDDAVRFKELLDEVLCPEEDD